MCGNGGGGIYTRKAKRKMKKAMRKYRLNVKGRIDRVLLGRV